MMKTRIALASALAVFPITSWAASVNYIGKVSLPDDFQVSSMDIHNTTALIGGVGSALVYDMEGRSTVASLIDPGGQKSAGFGSSVAVHDNRFLVGDGAGAYLYDFAGLPKVTMLGTPGAEDRTSFSEVALNEGTALVRTRNGEGQPNVGAYSARGGSLKRSFEYSPSEDEEFSDPSEFGAAVAIDGNIVAVSDTYNVRLIDLKDGQESVWTSDFFEVRDVDLEGDTLLTGFNDGGAYGFGTLYDVAARSGKYLPRIGGTNTHDSSMGYSVALSMPYALVADPAACLGGYDPYEDVGCGGNFGAVGLYDAVSGDFLARVDSPYGQVEFESFGRQIAMFGDDILISNGRSELFQYRLVEDGVPSAVPLPAAGWGLVGALFAMGAMGRAKRRTPAKA